MSKVVLRALDLIGDHLRTHKAGGGADAPLDLAKQVVQQRMDNPAPAAPPVAEAAPKNTTQGSVFAKKKNDKNDQMQGPQDQPDLREFLKKPSTNYKSWDDVPDINPQDLIGKKVGSLLADLTRAGGKYTGIDSSQVAKPEPMLGGPGYPLMDESQQHKLGWAVQGKGKGTAKLSKDMDYIAVHAMNPTSHLSNASMANAINETMAAYARDKRFSPEALSELNNLVRTTSTQKEHEKLKGFPGFEHPEIEKYLKDLNFESRLRISQLLGQTRSQELGAPNIDKITRDTLDKNFAGVPYGHAMFLLEIPKGSSESLVHLQQSNLPIHPSYDWGIHGRIVGKFAHPVAPEILHKDWFDQKQEENKTKVTPTGRPPNLRRAFELSLPTTTITKEIADMLPHRPAEIQSGKSAQLALNAFNDHWHDTDTPVNQGGLGPAALSQAVRNSDASSTLTHYSPDEINKMKREGKFTGYKLKDGEVYFGLKRGTNYADEYGFHHPDLTDNETALTSVVNNEPGAKGIGGAPVVLKALQHGATTLHTYSVPTDKHPNGFLPDFYSHFGFEKLGTVPFNEKSITHDENGNEKPFGKQHLADIKHEWAKTGWDENRHGSPSVAVMKWRGEDADRKDAVRNFVQKSGESYRAGNSESNVRRSTGPVQQSVGSGSNLAQGERGLGDTSGDRGPVGADNAPRSSDRFTRTLAAVKNLSPSDAQHYGLASEDINLAKANGLKRGGAVDNDVIPHGDPKREQNLTAFNPLKDENGKPKVLYHGTVGNYDKFSNALRGSATGAKSAEMGHWFTDTPRVAQSYAHYAAIDVPVRKLVEAAEKAGKRQDWDAHDKYMTEAEEMESHFRGPERDPENEKRGQNIMPVHLSMKNPHVIDADGGDFNDLEGGLSKHISYAKRKGHDGLVIKNLDDAAGIAYLPATHYMVFHPHQIKSATGNNGNFDPSNPDITKADGGEVDDIPDIKNPISVFPKPQRMFPEENRPAGGQYLNAKTKEDMTGHKAAQASIGIAPSGRPTFNVSPDAVEQTGSQGKGNATAKTNLFKQKAGWKWVDAPEGHEDTGTIVSVEHRGHHHYALNAHFPKGVDLARYENSTSEPRLRPTTKGNVTKGDQVGTISVRGKEHPVYNHVIVKAGGGPIVKRALELLSKDRTGR
jgi:hypothetical protein